MTTLDPAQITPARMRAFAPHCADPDGWAAALTAAGAKFMINTADRVAHFMAQTGEETGGYTVFEENLDYSAAALLRQWPNHFQTPEIADAYARQPEKIANRAYANRYGNGDEASGDGWRYRGRGPIQITFKAIYAAAAKEIGADCVANPDLLLVPANGALSTAAYWAQRGCNPMADRNDLIGITRLVNGGLGNLDHRQLMLTTWRNVVARVQS